MQWLSYPPLYNDLLEMGGTAIPALGQVFYIIHTPTGKCLTPKENKDLYKSKVELDNIDKNNEDQLWQIQQVSPGKCQIIHAKSCLILDQKDKALYLNWKKEGKATQSWYVERVSQASDNLLIKRDKQSSGCLMFSKSLLMEISNPTIESSYFQFKLAKQSLFKNSCIITSAHSRKAIDIQWACMKKGTRIIQWKKHKRFNQRWHLIRIGHVFAIQSKFSGMFLDIKDENRSPGGKIIQWPNNHKSNQMWRLELQEDKSYLISSVMDPMLILSVKDKSLADEAFLVTSKRDDPYFWQIEGHIPELFVT